MLKLKTGSDTLTCDPSRVKGRGHPTRPKSLTQRASSSLPWNCGHSMLSGRCGLCTKPRNYLLAQNIC